ncbi:MAG TPA: SRPBCC family protein [Candidatus Dormibacteraeota bacterium]|nr:SRPBCC family protein [Candidatus Dormibacteraeota bacterium]
MMIARASVLVSAPIQFVREAVLDPTAYSYGDTKVQDMVVESRGEDQLVARINGRLGPFKSFIRARYQLADNRVELTMLQGRLRDFHAVFLFEQEEDGVRLTHQEEYDFGYPLVTPLLERLLQRWATRSVQAEVNSLKHAAEARVPAPA